MKPTHILTITLLLPLLTVPLDVSAWAVGSLLATACVALVCATWLSQCWQRLANDAEVGDDDDR